MPSAPSRPLATAALVTTLVAGALGLHGVGYWSFRDRGPSGSAHRAAAARLRAQLVPGREQIFFLPAYATEGREWLGDLAPRAVADPLLEDLAPLDAVWLYGLFGADAPVAERFARAGHRVEPSERFEGGISLTRIALNGDGARVLWTATASIAAAEVSHLHPDGRRERCRRWQPRPGGGRWVCPHDAAWFYVGAEYHRMGERPRWCLWAHPPREGRLVVRFSGLPRGRSLVGRGGHTLNASRRAHAPVFMDVAVDGGTVQRFVFELEDTWRPFRMTVPARSSTVGPDRMDLELAISTPDNGANHFCFDVDLRVPRPRAEATR